jgi:uroporphyrinogen III methyltransferase/synthase
MGPQTLRVISRGSELAVTQVEEALLVLRDLWPAGAVIERTILDTPGDRDRTTPLDDAGVPDDFFTRDLDRALLDGRADLAVHSAKDLPETPVPGLTVAAYLPCREPRDALVLRPDLPEGTEPASVGTSSPRRTEQIRTYYPGIEPRPVRGDIRQRLAQLDAGAFDVLIVAACALDRLGLAERIHAYLPDDPAPNQGRLALVVQSTDTDLLRRLATVDVRRSAGLVALLGCPADPWLLPERTRRYLDAADVILHDRLIPAAVLARYREKTESVGKTGRGPSVPQGEVHRRMLMHAEQGRLVARLHGGDPGVFGHLAEELQFLHAWGLRTDVVPAVTAAQAAAARAQAPLTDRERGRQVTFISGHLPQDQDHDVPGPEAGHLAVYMGVGNRAAWVERLRRAGWPEETTVTVGQRIGYEDEQILHLRLSETPAAEVLGPAVMLAGPQPCGRRETTLFLGTEPDAFLRYGPLLHQPLIELVARPLEERLQALERHLAEVQGILFPSKFAVRTFFEALTVDRDARHLAGLHLLAVGPATAEALMGYGLRADLAAESLGGVRDLAARITTDLRGRYLYPCSTAAPVADRRRTLAACDIHLVPEVFYQNQRTAPRPLPARPFHRVLFTSASTVSAYFDAYPEERQADRTWLAVGPSTAKALEALALPPELLRPGPG